MRVLSLIHGREARSGLFGKAVRAAGHELDERSYALGDPPLAPPESYDAVLVLGGAMNVHEVEANAWIPEEKRVLARLLDEEVPILGVCLGGQMLASAAGARVSKAEEPEIGWHEVELTHAASDDPLFAETPDRFTAYEWHSYEFEVPDDGVLLATSRVCPQAFRLGGTAWGTQFHAEVTGQIVRDWITRYATDPAAARAGVDPERELGRIDEEIGRWNELGRKLVGGFLEFAAERAGERARA